MDNLTHTITGIVLARAGLGRSLPRAAWLLALASNAPDLDAITSLDSSLAYLHHHRGWTHAFAFSPAVALFVLPVWAWLVRKHSPSARQFAAAWLVATAGAAAHHLMDWLNVYGVRLLLPFRSDWYRLDLLYIVDLWVWLILFMAIAVPALTRLVYGEIGAKAGSGRGAAWFAIILLAAYFGLRHETHARALSQLDSRIYGGLPPLRSAAVPGPLNPLHWTGLIETRQAWHIVDIDLTRPFDPESGVSFHRPGLTPAVEAVRRTETAQKFLGFSQWPLWRIVPAPGEPGSVDVYIHDIRFGPPSEMRFTAKFSVSPQMRVTDEQFIFGSIGGGQNR